MGTDKAVVARRELGGRVRRRRVALRIPKVIAAAVGTMSPVTWSRVEDGLEVRELTYSGIEKTLEWAVGSCQLFLDQGIEPEELTDEPRAALEIKVPPAYYELTTSHRRYVDGLINQFATSRPDAPDE